MTRLTLSLLGTLRILLDEQPITRFGSLNVQGLLIYLALHAAQPVSRNVLATLFWPEETESHARANLRQTLHQLRKLLGDVEGVGQPFLLVSRHAVQFNPQSDFAFDVHQFLSAVEAHDLETAAALYQGDLLPGFTCDSLQFEEWLRQERENLHRLALEVMSELTEEHLKAGYFEQAQALARRQLTLEPWRERACRQLMRAYALVGDRANALAQFEVFRQILWEELGIEPAAETIALYKEIEEGRHGAEAVQGDLPQTVKNNLPAEPTPFVGREAELAALDAFIADPDVRLVTIAGSAGMGKTRLALAYAQRQLASADSFADGIFFVDLSTLIGPEQIVPALANAFEFSLRAEDARAAQQQLVDNLSRKKVLLLFDNFEHLLPGASVIAAITQAVQGARILVTSQQRLQLRGEQVFPVGGLAFPETDIGGSASPIENAAGFAAVQLFLQAARRSLPDFYVQDKAELAHLVEICGLVDGMPLALELAASWVDMLPLAEIEAEIRQGLDLLETDMRDVPARHRSLRAAIDNSWDKLDDAERTLFARLSVFRGGFTRAAATAVAGADLRRLGRLHSKSFLQYSKIEDRYAIHGLLRQFGAEKLAQDSEAEKSVRDAHSAYFCSALQQWQSGLESSRWLAAVAEIDADYRNILFAWEHALASGHLEQLICAVNGLGVYFDVKGRWLEGIKLFEQCADAVKLMVAAEPRALPLLTWLVAWQVHLSLSVYWDHHGTFAPLYDALIQPHQELLRNSDLAASPSRAADAFWGLKVGSVLKGVGGKREEGLEYLLASLQLFRELGNRLGEADVLYELHFYYSYDPAARDIERAERLIDQSLAILRSAAEPRRLNKVLSGKGAVTWAKHANSEAGETETDKYFEEAYQTAKAASYLIGMWEARNWLAHNGLDYGRYQRALAYTEEMFTLAQQANNPQLEYSTMAFIGWILLYKGDYRDALENLNTAAIFREEILGGKEPGFHEGTSVPIAQLHSGLYREIESARDGPARSWRMIWVYLVREEYEKALSLARSLLAALSALAFLGRPELQAVIGYAYHQLDRGAEARAVLYQGLQLCVEAYNLIALMQFLPVLPVVLSDTEDDQLKARALEIWFMCCSKPFVANSQLYANIIGRPLAAVAATLPAAAVEAARARGQELDWRETAASLLAELKELGWDQGQI